MPPPNNRLALPARNAMVEPQPISQQEMIARLMPPLAIPMGISFGMQRNLEGTAKAITDPVGMMRNIYETGVRLGKNPIEILTALREARQKFMSGPFAASQMLAENISVPRVPRPNVMRELDVYHGTPHEFPPTPNNPLGEFDASKIGTGEGAQAYGHGIYFAQQPGVAKGYMLAGNGAYPSVSVFGKKAQEFDEFGPDAGEFFDVTGKKFGELTGAQAKELALQNAPAHIAKKYKDVPDSAFTVSRKKGNFYKADLPDEMIGRMLDWDKPLKEQPANVQKFFSPIYKPDDYLVDWLKQGDANHIAEILREAGIPGIKYLDAGSRGQGGTGTRNFVVFPGEEKKVQILERK